VAAALCFAVVEPGARAQSPAAPVAPRAGPLRVEISVVGDAPELEALPARVASWFEGNVALVQTRRFLVLPSDSVLTPSENPGVQIWILLDNPFLARLFFSLQEQSGAIPRYLVTEVPLLTGLDEIGMERVAQVAYLSATALWEGQLASPRSEVKNNLRANASEQPLPPPPTATSVREPAAPRWKSKPRFGLDYGVRFRGAEGLAHGPAASIAGFWSRRGLELGAPLRAQLLLPETTDARGTKLSLQGYAFSIGAALGFEAARDFWLTAEVGPGLDVVRHRTVSVSDVTLRPSANQIDLRPVTQLGAGVRARLGPISVAVTARLTVQWFRTHYDVAETSGRSQLLTPWIVQPGFFAGVYW
jgi:hypothetical protein